MSLRLRVEMPLILALLASSLLHVAVVVAPGWGVPEPFDDDLPTTIDAVLAKPAVRPETAPAAKPVPKSQARKPPSPSAAAPVVVAESPPDAPLVAPPPVEEVAVPPEPSFEPTAPSPARTALPGKGVLRYVITRGEQGFVIGRAVHSWEHDGFSYRLKSMTETIGVAALFKPTYAFQSSQGEITDDGLRPREFRHERPGNVDTASFDWISRIAAYSGRVEPLAAGTQDLLSMYYQLVLLAPRDGMVEFPIATGRKLMSYRFEVIGEEALDFPSGTRRTVHIKARSGNDNIDMWLPIDGPDDQSRSLPLKIRITDRKGEIYDQIAEVQPLPETR